MPRVVHIGSKPRSRKSEMPMEKHFISDNSDKYVYNQQFGDKWVVPINNYDRNYKAAPAVSLAGRAKLSETYRRTFKLDKEKKNG